ncbi:MAG: 4-(cytidine 5'-diphospho)-2-C-methyl-D-erythritol kinase [Planctomycetaceae bacterium]|nr:4-(cytidine 5'-diphospho)-2-C-methyl-D-erythritol kinase [Planctomycetaceae bacterium]
MLIRQFGIQNSPDGRTLLVHTPAKLNLFLDVLGKRADGFHELITLMAKVSLFDTLSFTEDSSGTIQLQCCNAGSGSGAEDSLDTAIPSGQDNLVVRAARLLQDYSGTKRGARIGLLKRIPAAAGLAGGSSDAAATLKALNQLWQVGLDDRELHSLASQLGSDINFFLGPTPLAVCRGRGEIIEPISLPVSMHFTIVWPDVGLSTADVFRQLNNASLVSNDAGEESRQNSRNTSRPCTDNSSVSRFVERMIEDLQRGDFGQFSASLHNSLQPPAEQLSKEVRYLKSVFDNLPVLGHMMSGSGSAYFGICRHRQQAQNMAARLRARRLGRVFAVSTQS